MNKYLNILRDLNQELESYTEADWKELLIFCSSGIGPKNFCSKE